MGRGKDLITLNQAMRMNITATTEDFNGTKLNLEKITKQINEQRPRCFCHRAENLKN